MACLVAAAKTFARWDDISLVGYELPPPRRWSPGDEIAVTLYWNPLAPSSELPSLLHHAVSTRTGRSWRISTAFPGWGSLPPTWWQPGVIYRDDLRLRIPADAEGMTTGLAQLHIGWYKLVRQARHHADFGNRRDCDSVYAARRRFHRRRISSAGHGRRGRRNALRRCHPIECLALLGRAFAGAGMANRAGNRGRLACLRARFSARHIARALATKC